MNYIYNSCRHYSSKYLPKTEIKGRFNYKLLLSVATENISHSGWIYFSFFLSFKHMCSKNENKKFTVSILQEIITAFKLVITELIVVLVSSCLYEMNDLIVAVYFF